jgi:hypothetical protein
MGTTPVRGDLADLYDAGEAIVKIPRDPAVNDLLEREAIALRQLPKDGDGRFLPYVPRLLESFRHRDEATGTERRANAIGPSTVSARSPRCGPHTPAASTPATWRGCGGGCWSRWASRTGRASCTARCCPSTCSSIRTGMGSCW